MIPYACVLMQSWPWGTFGDKWHEKNLVNNAMVAFLSFSAQRLPSLTIFFPKNYAENEAGRLVPDLFLFMLNMR